MVPFFEDMKIIVKNISYIQINYSNNKDKIDTDYEAEIKSLNEDESNKKTLFNRYLNLLKSNQIDFETITGFKIHFPQNPPLNTTLTKSIQEYLSDVDREVERVKKLTESPDRSGFDIKKILIRYFACLLISIISLVVIFSYTQIIPSLGLTFLLDEPYGAINCSFILLTGFVAGSLFLKKHSNFCIIICAGVYFGLILTVIAQQIDVLITLIFSLIFSIGLFPIALRLDFYFTRIEINMTLPESKRIFSDANWKIIKDKDDSDKYITNKKQLAENKKLNDIKILQDNYNKEVKKIKDAINLYSQNLGYSGFPWNSNNWNTWKPGENLPGGFSFGSIRCKSLPLPDIPAFFPLFPGKHLLFLSEDGNNPEVNLLMQSIALRLFATIPPDQCILYFIDPLGLGENAVEFASIQHKRHLIGERIWTTDPEVINIMKTIQEHITRINTQKLASRRYNIEQYNQANPEYSEPYRFVFIYGITLDLLRRLVTSLDIYLNNKCGVYFFIQMAQETNFVDKRFSVINWTGKEMKWDELSDTSYVSLYPDRILDNTIANTIIETIDNCENQVVNILFESVYNTQGPGFWNNYLSVKDNFEISIGKRSHEEDQLLVLGEIPIGNNIFIYSNVLISGKPGSGKSNLLHDIILGFATKYSPDEINLWLLDYKDGVEFERYRNLNHARIIGLCGEVTDLDYALAVLKHLQEEINKRNNLFINSGSGNSYKQYRANHSLPRIILVVDEYQRLFIQGDDCFKEIEYLIDDIARRGRSVGIHLIFSSQTISQKKFIPWFDIRFAFGQTDAQESRNIIGNDGATGLPTGQAIYRTPPGTEKNLNYQFTVYRALDDTPARAYINEINNHHPNNLADFKEKKIFSVFEPTKVSKRHIEFIRNVTDQYLALVGDPVEFRDPVVAVFEKTYGSNLSIITGDDFDAIGTLFSSIFSLLLKNTNCTICFFISDIAHECVEEFNSTIGRLQKIAGENNNQFIFCTTMEQMKNLVKQIEERISQGNVKRRLFLVIGKFQTFFLQQNMDQSTIDSLIYIAQNGPEIGIHCIIHTSTYDYWNQFSEKVNRNRNNFNYRLGGRMTREMSLEFMNRNNICSIIPLNVKHRGCFYSFNNNEYILLNMFSL